MAEGKTKPMAVRRIFSYVQVLAIAVLMIGNAMSVAAASVTLDNGDCAVVQQHSHSHQDAGKLGGASSCCSTMHCCSLLPEPAMSKPPNVEPNEIAVTSSRYLPLLLIWPIDPPPKTTGV
ncbi:hypothetical protein [Rhizobium leguminosarum]|uniref:hypothetical protein n=1 Tax=Rhizobium leguminosarum TaxID=384 RepID=UPI003F9501AD